LRLRLRRAHQRRADAEAAQRLRNEQHLDV
jgi:hypothetical protein